MNICYSKAQRSKYIELRTANPGMRARSDLALGPRIKVEVTNSQRCTLERPEEYFVALDVYQKDNPNKAINESDKCWEFIAGKWIEGVL